MIEVKGYKVKNSPSEMTIKEWEELSLILRKSVFNPEKPDEEAHYSTKIERCVDALVFCGMPRELEDELDLEEFGTIWKEFNTTEPIEPVNEFELDGRVYKSHEKGEPFKISISKWKILEKLVTKNPKRIIGEVIAVLFEDENLTETEHKTEAHIKRKAKIFRERLNAGIAVPYVAFVTQKLMQQRIGAIEKLQQVQTQKENAEN